MAFIICIAALIIMMFVFTKMLLSFGNNSSAAVESVDATVVEKKQGIYTHILTMRVLFYIQQKCCKSMDMCVNALARSIRGL